MDGFQWNQIISRFPHIAEGIFDGLDGNTGFQYACKSGHDELVELMIKKSVELNIDLIAKDRHGKNGYHYACESGHVKIVELLMNKIEGTPILNLAMVKRVLVKISVKKIRQKKFVKKFKEAQESNIEEKGQKSDKQTKLGS